ncbi:hypothetical protein JCGZ_27151 [Jatropha curcas]|uniref:Uncharacterized protein n=1 Tax=Jatropha curcas TaxID=180498 RepID=A0A067JIZ9_JATCU|nr:hypothetical protein JCGZ_27151 [Jatropha curcas]
MALFQDDENKGESKKKEQVDEIWQDEEIFAKKVTNTKAESEIIAFEKLDKLEKMDKKIKKINVFMKSKGLDQYLDMDDDEDEELELKSTIPLTYKMPKLSKYDGTGDPKVHACSTKL